MSQSLVVCEVDDDLVQRLKEFRFRKETNNAAIIKGITLVAFLNRRDKIFYVYDDVKIDRKRQLVVLDEELEDISPDDLRGELPDCQPRYVVYSYKYEHDDGRVSYPLCLIFISPLGCQPDLQMMYAGSKNKLVLTSEIAKVFEVRSADDLTEEWLRERLGFFG